MKPDVTGIDNVLTSRPGFSPFAGTAAAAPHVAAIAALVLQQNPALAPASLRDLLRQTAVDLGPPGFDEDFGSGRVDAVQASAGAGGLPALPSLTLTLNRASFAPGETMTLTATVTPGFTAPLVDAYVVVRLPDGSFLSLLLDGRIVPGLVPIARGFTPFAFNAEVLRWIALDGRTHAGVCPEIRPFYENVPARAARARLRGAPEPRARAAVGGRQPRPMASRRRAQRQDLGGISRYTAGLARGSLLEGASRSADARR